MYAFPLFSSQGRRSARTYKIAILAGDGIGKEVVVGLAAIEAAIRGTGITIERTDLPWGCDYYLEKGRMMDEDGFRDGLKFDAIYLGAIGFRRRSPITSPCGICCRCVGASSECVNLRPMRRAASPRRSLTARRLTSTWSACVRTGRRAAGVGGRVLRGHGTRSGDSDWRLHAHRHRAHRALRIFSRRSVRARCSQAPRSRTPCVAMVMWDEVADIVAKDYPNVEYRARQTRSARAWSPTRLARCHRLLEPVRRHPDRHRLGGQPRHRPGANINPGGRSLDVPNRFTAQRLTSPARVSPIRLAIHGPPRRCSITLVKDVHDKILRCGRARQRHPCARPISAGKATTKGNSLTPSPRGQIRQFRHRTFLLCYVVLGRGSPVQRASPPHHPRFSRASSAARATSSSDWLLSLG